MTHSKDNITYTHEDSCCASKGKITLVSSHKHNHNHDHEGHDHEHGHSHEESEESLLKSRWTLWMSLLIVLTYLLLKWGFGMAFSQNTTFVLMAIAYLGAGYKTVWKALKLIGNANLFNEFTLMTLATLGAFYIGEYTEGVAVMLFYEIGELFQDLAVNRSKKSIKALLDVRLEKAGIKVIQIDEPAIREGLPLRKADWANYLDWAVKAFRLSAAGVRNETQIHTHMCYSEFNDIIQHIAAMDADVITIETSRSQMELLDAFADFKYPNEIGPGVYDIHSPRVPSIDEIVFLLEKALNVIPARNLWVNPDCGLKTRHWTETEAALKNMIAATEKIREAANAEII